MTHQTLEAMFVEGPSSGVFFKMFCRDKLPATLYTHLERPLLHLHGHGVDQLSDTMYCKYDLQELAEDATIPVYLYAGDEACTTSPPTS